MNIEKENKQYNKKEVDRSVPPHDIDAEKSVLGAILMDNASLVNAVEFLRAKHFYRQAHQYIYQAIVDLYERREPSDLITVPAELRKEKKLDAAGGITYLTELVNFVPTSANIEHYAKIIRDLAVRRYLITAAGNISDLAYESADVDGILDRAEQTLFSVSQDKSQKDFTPIKEVLEVTFERLDELSQTRGALRGVPTGFKTLDKMLSGLRKGDLIILAARPSVGKTSFATNIAQHAATKHGKNIVYFSLEMGSEAVIERMISSQGDIDNWRIATGNLEPEDFEKYALAAAELSEASFDIDDTPGLSVLEMRTKARRLALEKKIDLVVVDYLQLARSGGNRDNRVQEVAEISQGLKNLARELNVPVMALSQLSRSVEQRGGDKKPQLSDLRDSGSIEQDADVVAFLYRPDEENRENIRLFIAKHRNGATGEIDLYFKGDRTKFYEVAKQNSEN